MRDDGVRQLLDDWMSGSITRRELARRMALLGLAAPAIGAAMPRGVAAGAAQDEPVELLYMTHDNATAVAVNERLIEEFRQQHPNVTVTYDHAPHENFEQKVLTAFAGGQGPDLFWAGDWMMPQFVDNEILAPVDASSYGVASPQEFAGLYEQGALDAFVAGDRVLTGGISEYNTFSLIYHPAHFEEAGLPLPSATEPMTWEQVAESAQKLTKVEGGNRVRSGIEWNYNVPIWTVLCFEPMLRQIGGELTDPESGQPNFTSQEMVRVMQYLQDLRTQRQASDPAFVVDLVEDFANGRISMIEGGPWALPAVRAINPEARVAVAPLPVFEGGERSTALYAWAWFVSAASPPEKQRAAWELLAFLTSRGRLWWDEAGYIQPRTDQVENGQSLADYRVSTMPEMAVFLDDFTHGAYQFRSTNYFEISSAWTRALTRIMEGDEVQAVLEETQQEFS